MASPQFAGTSALRGHSVGGPLTGDYMSNSPFYFSPAVIPVPAHISQPALGVGARDATTRDRHSSVGHGSGAGRSHRQRSRDRLRARPPISTRSTTEEREAALRELGPQNRMEFDEIIEGIYDRLDSLERYSRHHASCIAPADAAVSNSQTEIRKLNADIQEYKGM